MNCKSRFRDLGPRPSQRFRTASAAFMLLCPIALMGQGTNPCDLNGDGTVNMADVTAAVSMALGQSACSSTVVGPGTCNVVLVQRVVNAALGGTCVVGEPHTVLLNWIASVSPNVIGYNVYRAISPSSQFVKLTTSPVSGTTYNDGSVQAGQTYLYAVTSVDDLGDESALSAQTTVTIPSP